MLDILGDAFAEPAGIIAVGHIVDDVVAVFVRHRAHAAEDLRLSSTGTVDPAFGRQDIDVAHPVDAHGAAVAFPAEAVVEGR